MGRIHSRRHPPFCQLARSQCCTVTHDIDTINGVVCPWKDFQHSFSAAYHFPYASQHQCGLMWRGMAPTPAFFLFSPITSSPSPALEQRHHAPLRCSLSCGICLLPYCHPPAHSQFFDSQPYGRMRRRRRRGKRPLCFGVWKGAIHLSSHVLR